MTDLSKEVLYDSYYHGTSKLENLLQKRVFVPSILALKGFNTKLQKSSEFDFRSFLNLASEDTFELKEF